MLLSAFKRRWPVLTTVVAAMLWVVNNYDIRGLDGLRLEPRTGAVAQSTGLTTAPLGFPTGYSAGPALPSTSSGSGMSTWPGNGTLTTLPNSAAFNLPGANPMTGDSMLPGSGMQAGNSMQPNAYGMSGNNMSPNGMEYSAGYPSGNGSMPQLPGTSPVGGSVGSRTGMLLPGNMNLDALRPAVDALAGDDWGKLLSVGEKLGMLERSRQAAVAPIPLPTTANPPGPIALAAAPGVMPTAAANVQRDSIRIASFNMSGWGDAQRSQPALTEMIVRLISQFDVVALQDIRSRRDDLLPNLISQMNSTGRVFDFMIGPRVGRGEDREQLAFIFDTAKVETDRFQLYTVADPEDLLLREPLVGWFRAKQVDSREAFTFSLVNVHVDGNRSAVELELLPNLVEAIFADGRGEDDVILAGDFSMAAQQTPFFASSVVRQAIEGIATNTRGTALIDNIVMPVAGSSEFTGRSGAVDFLRQYNLSLEQAVGVSEHLPIWAEFSIIEGGRPGQVAGNSLPERSFQSGIRYGGLTN